MVSGLLRDSVSGHATCPPSAVEGTEQLGPDQSLEELCLRSQEEGSVDKELVTQV